MSVFLRDYFTVVWFGLAPLLRSAESCSGSAADAAVEP
jgi:hypothetical protein